MPFEQRTVSALGTLPARAPRRYHLAGASEMSSSEGPRSRRSDARGRSERSIAPSVGERIRALRGERTVPELTKAEPIDPAAWSRWESGETVPSLANAIRICELLGVSIGELFDAPPQDTAAQVPLVSLAAAAGIEPLPDFGGVRLVPVPASWIDSGGPDVRHVAVTAPRCSVEGSPIPAGSVVVLDRGTSARTAFAGRSEPAFGLCHLAGQAPALCRIEVDVKGAEAPAIRATPLAAPERHWETRPNEPELLGTVRAVVVGWLVAANRPPSPSRPPRAAVLTPEEWALVPLSWLRLPPRVAAALKRRGPTTVGELLSDGGVWSALGTKPAATLRRALRRSGVLA